MVVGLLMIGLVGLAAGFAVGFMLGMEPAAALRTAFISAWSAMLFLAALRLLADAFYLWRARQRLSDAERGGEPGAGSHER
jgi:membrane protein implicated in regulation of membrane protease activity